MNKAVRRRYERIYGIILKLYPKEYQKEFGDEMKYVFSESLKDANKEHGEGGLSKLWGRTILDAGQSIVTQHIENQKEGDSMKQKSRQLIKNNKDITAVIVATFCILLIPIIGMQVSSEWDWTVSDFVIIAALLLGSGLVYVLAARKLKKYRVIIGAVILLAVLLIWIELAVGIFGSPFAGN